MAAVGCARQAPAPSAEIIDLTQRMRRWRGLTVITGTLAACFVGIVLAREYRPDVLPADWRPKQQVVERVVEKPVEVVREVVREVPSARPAQFVAVFQKDEQSPAFLMSVDIEKRVVTVRQVAAERLADKSYQLWIAPQPGSAPQSLGVIEQQDDFTVRATLAALRPGRDQQCDFRDFARAARRLADRPADRAGDPRQAAAGHPAADPVGRSFRP